MNRKPLVIVIHGPAGVGKDSVINLLFERTGIGRATSSTTRAMRKGERNHIDYHFVTVEEFERGVAAGEFVEHARVYDDMKGVLASEVIRPVSEGRDLIIRTDVQGARTWRKKLDGAVYIFLLPGTSDTPDVPPGESIAQLMRSPAVIDEVREELRKRLTDRETETVDSLQRRLAEIDEEIKDIPNNDYVVYNRKGELDRAVDEVQRIMAYERANPARPVPRLRL